ncbi:MAG: hypothetical protein ABWW65_07885 [Thermoprotei archaeon]
MPNCRELLETISEWLRQGTPGAEKLVDFPWEVSSDEKGLKAIYPRFPIDVVITCDDKLGVLRLSVQLQTETFTLEKDVKLIVYHKFLRRNVAPLVKYSLTGDEDIPTLMVDLSTKTLGKDEFNDALAMLLAAVNDAIKMLGLEEYYREAMFSKLLDLVKKHIEEGWSREDLYNYLVVNAGVKEEEAAEIIDSLLEKERRKPSVYV